MSQTEGPQSVGGRLLDGLHKVLNLSSDVRRPEVVGVLLFLSNLFVVLPQRGTIRPRPRSPLRIVIRAFGVYQAKRGEDFGARFARMTTK